MTSPLSPAVSPAVSPAASASSPSPPPLCTSLIQVMASVAIRTMTVLAPIALVLSAAMFVRGIAREPEVAREPLPLLHAAAALLLSVSATCIYFVLERHWRVRMSKPLSKWLPPAALAALLLAGLGAIASSASGWERAFVWLTALGAAAIVFRDRRALAHSAGEQPSSTMEAAAPMLDVPTSSEESDGSPDADGEGELDCRLERRRLDSGDTIIAIWQRVSFRPWQQRATLHFPFWPPLPAPQVSGETTADCEAELRIQQVETHGCRVLVELEEADERPQEVMLELCVIAAADEPDGVSGPPTS